MNFYSIYFFILSVFTVSYCDEFEETTTTQNDLVVEGSRDARSGNTSFW